LTTSPAFAIPALETEGLIRAGLGEVELADNINRKVAFVAVQVNVPT
jgi:hypothetical protein